MIITFRFISDEEDDFVLDVNIKHDQTFLELHQTIQKQLGYDENQLASFFTSNDDWEKLQEVALMDMGSDQESFTMDKTKIEQLFSKKNDRILYVFDFFAERLFFGSITRTIDQESPIPLPSVSRFEGIVPEQFQNDNMSMEDDLNLDDFNMDDDLGLDDDMKFESLDDLEDIY